MIASGLLDARPVAYVPRRIPVRTARVAALLGTQLQDAEVATLLGPLGFATRLPETADEAGLLEVEVPSFRPDVRREADVTEEVARRIGYQELPTSQRRSAYVGRLTDLQILRRRLRRILTGLGAHEAWTMSVVEACDQLRGGVTSPLVSLLNPMVAEESVLRGGLLPGLLGAVRHNVSHRHPWLRLFEIGDVFALPAASTGPEPAPPGPPAGTAPELPEEWELVGLLLADVDDDAGAAVNAWRVIADALGLEGAELRPAQRAGLHPARTAEIDCGGTVLGVVGEVDPETLEAYELGAAAGGLARARPGEAGRRAPAGRFRRGR